MIRSTARKLRDLIFLVIACLVIFPVILVTVVLGLVPIEDVADALIDHDPKIID